MKGHIRNCAAAVAMLVASAVMTGTADAAAERIYLTSAQRGVVISGVNDRSVKVQVAPSEFEAAVGQVVPPSMTLHTLPTEMASRIPAVSSYSFVLSRDELWIVDPRDRRIVEVISRK